MPKKLDLLSYIIANLGVGEREELTLAAEELFPELALAIAQRSPNKRETWIMSLMVGGHWHVRVQYQDLYDRFRAEAVTDTYTDSRCHQILQNNLTTCCPGWEMEKGEITFPGLATVRANCERLFGKVTWPMDDVEAMKVMAQEQDRIDAEVAASEMHDTESLAIALEWRENTMESMEVVRVKEGAAHMAAHEYARTAGRPDAEREPSRVAMELANAAEAMAKTVAEGILKEADDRRRQRHSDLSARLEHLD